MTRQTGMVLGGDKHEQRFFRVVCDKQPQVLPGLVKVYEASPVLKHQIWFPDWAHLMWLEDLFHVENKNPESFHKPFGLEDIETDDLRELRTALQKWSKANAIQTLEPWTFDLALGIFEQWSWHPRVPHTRIEFARGQPDFIPGIWWQIGKPDDYSFEDSNFVFEFEGKNKWLETQMQKKDRVYLDREPQNIDYNPLHETRTATKKRLRAAFDKQLEIYLDTREQLAKKKGFLRAKSLDKRQTHRETSECFLWLYDRYFGRLTIEKVADKYGVDQGKSLSAAAVSAQTVPLAEQIGLVL